MNNRYNNVCIQRMYMYVCVFWWAQSGLKRYNPLCFHKLVSLYVHNTFIQQHWITMNSLPFIRPNSSGHFFLTNFHLKAFVRMSLFLNYLFCNKCCFKSLINCINPFKCFCFVLISFSKSTKNFYIDLVSSFNLMCS